MDAIFHIYKSSLCRYVNKGMEDDLKRLSSNSIEYEQAFIYHLASCNTGIFLSLVHQHTLPYDVLYEPLSEGNLKPYEDKFRSYLHNKLPYINQ